MSVSAVVPRRVLLSCLLLLPFFLNACTSTEKGVSITDIASDKASLNLNRYETASISYHINRDTALSAFIEGPQGQETKRYELRHEEPRSPGDYVLQLDGAVEKVENGLVQRRILPAGKYRFLLQTLDGGSGSVNFTITESPSEQGFPEIESISADPAVISPNFDAKDDVATLNWRTSRPATVTVSVSGANAFNRVLKTSKNQPSGEDRAEFNGLDQKNEPLADGIYTYTIQAADRYGNITRRASTLEVRGGGIPQATISFASIAPVDIIQGNIVTVTLKVKNTGKVPIRSQGPDSGFMYSTRDVFSSLENGKYDDKAGFWRVGVDFESNSGSGGPVRYPFRWGFGTNHELQPGEEAEVTGLIKIDKQEKEIKLFAGLIQEKIKLVQDRLQVTLVKISY